MAPGICSRQGTEKEDSCPEAEHFVGEVQLPCHIEAGEPDVHPVNVSCDVDQEKKGE